METERRARRGRRPPWHAWALLAAGIAATLGANIAHGADHGPIGALVAVGSFELATRLLDGDRRAFVATEAMPTADRRTETTDSPEPAPPQPEVHDPLVNVALEHFSALLSEGRLPTLRTLKNELKIGHARAARVRAALAARLQEPGR